ncbi:MAG: nuclear transport factor 2 family protein [Gemmatimonadota bacterium]|nr:nuclear transport factor 2 family protein [Gemmatimonadota bacterium]
MCRLFAVTLLSAILGSLPASLASAQASKSTERTLFRLEDDWTRALIKRDSAAFNRLIAPAWVYSDERGVIDKSTAILEFTTGSDTVTASSNESMKAFVYGDAAVVIGVLVTEGRGKDGPFRHRYRYTDTWARLRGRWQCVASQDYDMPPK